jgi:hypothetical protein
MPRIAGTFTYGTVLLGILPDTAEDLTWKDPVLDCSGYMPTSPEAASKLAPAIQVAPDCKARPGLSDGGPSIWLSNAIHNVTTQSRTTKLGRGRASLERPDPAADNLLATHLYQYSLLYRR